MHSENSIILLKLKPCNALTTKCQLSTRIIKYECRLIHTTAIQL